MLITSQLSNTTTPPLTAGAATPLTAVPPGPCELTISNVSGVTVYLGTSTTVTVTNGFPLPNNAPPVKITVFRGSGGGTLYAIAGAGSVTGGVGVIVSTDH